MSVLSLPEAERLAPLLLAAIDRQATAVIPSGRAHFAADRERVESDLAGLRRHATEFDVCYRCWGDMPCADALAYSANLRRTASLYLGAVAVGETPARETL